MEEIYHYHLVDDTVSLFIILHLGVNHSGKHYQLESYAYNEMQFRVPDQRGDQPVNCPVILADHHHHSMMMIPYQASVPTHLYHVLEPMCQQLNDTLHRRRSNHPITTTTPLALRGSSGSTPISTNHHDDDYGTTCVISTDPGRFVCNYVYFYSLSVFRVATHDAPVAENVRRETTTTIEPPNDSNDSDADSIRPYLTNVKCLFVHVPPLTVASVPQQLRFVTDLMRLLEQELMSSSSESA